jgi:hypothetical protein
MEERKRSGKGFLEVIVKRLKGLVIHSWDVIRHERSLISSVFLVVIVILAVSGNVLPSVFIFTSLTLFLTLDSLFHVVYLERINKLDKLSYLLLISLILMASLLIPLFFYSYVLLILYNLLDLFFVISGIGYISMADQYSKILSNFIRLNNSTKMISFSLIPIASFFLTRYLINLLSRNMEINNTIGLSFLAPLLLGSLLASVFGLPYCIYLLLRGDRGKYSGLSYLISSLIIGGVIVTLFLEGFYYDYFTSYTLGQYGVNIVQSILVFAIGYSSLVYKIPKEISKRFERGNKIISPLTWLLSMTAAHYIYSLVILGNLNLLYIEKGVYQYLGIEIGALIFALYRAKGNKYKVIIVSLTAFIISVLSILFFK